MNNAGICIGGPMDGQRLTYYGTIYNVEVLPKGPQDYTNPAMGADDASEMVSYYYTSSVYHHGSDTRTIAFWVLKDATILDAFDALAERYQEKRKANELLVRAARMIYQLMRNMGPQSPADWKESRAIVEEVDKGQPDGLRL